MKRREFLATSVAMGAVSGLAAESSADITKKDEREYFEFIQYHLHVGSKKNLVADFYRDVAIPALNRIGVGPIGVFSSMYGPNKPTLYVLMPHKSLESVVTKFSRLLEDDEFQKSGAGFLNATLADPAYVRIESSLMIAFSHMPAIEIPKSLMNNNSRIFEIRIYESHSRVAGKKKVEMFNEGGEIAIFKKTGLNPILFGETIIGPMMPNLIYMLAFENMDARAQNWERFRNDPDWLKLREVQKYKNTVSNITDIILRPASFSQI